jgi:uncharacterized spore protein YtfJ
MSNSFNEVVASAMQSWKEGTDLVGRLFNIAQPDAVYSEPVSVGEYTVITASEVTVSMGFGYGAGGGSSPEMGEGKPSSDGGEGGGGGGGGGGVALGRPVAVISIGPQGVHVEPVVDVTKLGLAFITALGGMLLMGIRMRRRH